MNKETISRFEKRLLEEKAELEKSLISIGKRDPSAPGGWDATSGGLDVDPADENEVADKFEEIEDNTAVVNQLEAQLTEVKAALERIKNGTYGISEDTGESIDIARLEANPSARTSIK